MKEMRPQLGDHILYRLYFADNQIADQDDLDCMQLRLDCRKLREVYKIAGLIINWEKSKFMAVGNEDEENMKLGDTNMSGQRLVYTVFRHYT